MKYFSRVKGKKKRKRKTPVYVTFPHNEKSL